MTLIVVLPLFCVIPHNFVALEADYVKQIEVIHIGLLSTKKSLQELR